MEGRKWRVQINGAGGRRGRVLGIYALNYINKLFRVGKWMTSGMINFVANMEIGSRKLRPE